MSYKIRLDFLSYIHTILPRYEGPCNIYILNGIENINIVKYLYPTVLDKNVTFSL